MAIPDLRVEIAWDSGFATAEGDRTWTDVSDYVEGQQGLEVSYGRADELTQADPNRLSVTFDNRDGRFTPGNASSVYSPNVKKGKPIRASVRYAEDGAGNLLSANAASMETSIADWVAGGTVPPTLSSSAVRAHEGTKSLLVTWGTGGTLPLAYVLAAGLVVGRTYTASAWVWVPTGSPNVRLVRSTLGAATSVKDAWARISVTFVAAASSHQIQLWPSTAPTAGQQVWLDSAMVDEGSSVDAFTTAAPPVYTRFVGYVNDWPVVWPQGTGGSSQVTVSATSRRARLGQTAPLTSAIRAAYLATSPEAYWPMDEALVNFIGQSVFFDVTNTIVNQKPTQSLASFYTTPALAPVASDGSQGPTDEGSLVRFPRQSTPDLYAHYVGAGNAISVNPAGGVTAEAVARIQGADVSITSTAFLFGVFTPDLAQGVEWVVASDGTGDPADTGGGPFITYYDADSNTLVGSDIVDLYNPSIFTAAADGAMHHFAITLGGGDTIKAYLDGVLVRTGNLDNPWSYSRTFTHVIFGHMAHNVTTWIGHGAVHSRVLTAAEILTRANAATAVTETPEERVVRVAGRIGVPASEIDVQASIVDGVGPQPEATRSAAEVLDELATSTGGIFYDTRNGHLALQSRDSRYNKAASLTLSAALQEVEVDLVAVLDDRYLVNAVEVNRVATNSEPVEDRTSTATVTNAASIDAYGVYTQSLTVTSTSDTQAEAAAQDMLYRYAEPSVRINQVSVDVGDLSDAQRGLLLAADIGTRIDLAGLPPQAPATTMPLFLEGYTESIGLGGHTLTMNTTPADVYDEVLILDDATRGTVETTNVLAY